MSYLKRLKNLLGLKSSVTATPDRVSEIVAQVKEAGATDLRSVQRRLYAEQLQFRKDKPIRDEVKRQATLDYRRRVRRPQSQAKVAQTGALYDGSLVMLLTNGQIVNCAKPHQNPHLRALIHDTMLADIAASGDKGTAPKGDK